MSELFEQILDILNLFDIFVIIIFIYCVTQCFINAFYLCFCTS